MKKRERVLWGILDAVIILWMHAGCGAIPTPTPTPVPGPTDYSQVCKHLADLGCAEGAAPECDIEFQRIQGGRMADLRPDCLASAQSPAAARARGSVLCE